MGVVKEEAVVRGLHLDRRGGQVGWGREGLKEALGFRSNPAEGKELIVRGVCVGGAWPK